MLTVVIQLIESLRPSTDAALWHRLPCLNSPLLPSSLGLDVLLE